MLISKRSIAVLIAVIVTLNLMPAVFATNDDAGDLRPEVIIDGEASGVDLAPSQKPEVCGFSLPEEETYGAQLIAIRRKLKVETEEEFRVKIFMKNTGSMPWFSNKSKCLGPKMSLGTDKQRDAASAFYQYGLAGWEGDNRIGMDQLRVDSGEIASFTFWGFSGDRADVFKQYLTPVLKGLQWVDSAGFYFEVMVGENEDSAINLRKKMAYANFSGSVSVIDLNAEKSLHVDLSDQKVHVKLGEQTIREFPLSTGAAKTPTPKGETKILLKQEVRIGAKAPHYVMPKYMMFRAGGYGFHALPSLAGDGGVFWTEARNHIGIPVSHGCIRLLPEDAEWLFDFTDIGTKVVVAQ